MAESLDNWFEGAPVFSIVNDQQFDNWFLGAPVLQFVNTGASLTGVGTVAFSGSGSLSGTITVPNVGTRRGVQIIITI